MPEVLSGTACRKADFIAINQYGISSLALMENAAESVCKYLREHFAGKRLLVLCGTGNNGADGIAIARKMGCRYIVVGSLEKGSWEFYHQLAEAKSCGNAPEFYHGQELGECDVLVDAVFGIGLKRNIEGQFKQLLQAANEMKIFKVAVDVPSGLNADSGEIMGTVLSTDVTVTFGKMKTGLINCKEAGRVIVADIGIPEEIYAEADR